MDYNNRLKRSEPDYVSTRDFKKEAKNFFNSTNITGATLYDIPNIYENKLKPGTNVTINTGTYEDKEKLLKHQTYARNNKFSTFGAGTTSLHFKSYVGTDTKTGELKAFVPTGNQKTNALKEKKLLDHVRELEMPDMVRKGLFIAEREGYQDNTGIFLTNKKDIQDLIILQDSISKGTPIEKIGNFQVGSEIYKTLDEKVAKTKKGDRITISSPFLDSPDLLNDLIEAKRRGVDVNLLLSPGGVDSSKRIAVRRRAEKYGLKVYSSDVLQHQKNVVISGSQNLALTGSSNLTDASYSNRTLDYAYVLKGQSKFQQEMEQDLLNSISKSTLQTGNYSELDSRNEYSFTRRALGATSVGDKAPSLQLETVANMPTSMSTEFFDRYRGDKLPVINMYQTRYLAITGNKNTPQAVLEADKALITPSIGEQLNRALGVQVYYKGEGVIGSAFRSIGRFLDNFTGQQLAYDQQQRFTGQLRGGIAKYEGLNHKELEAPEGFFESLASNTILNAKGFALGVFSLGASISTTYAMSAAMETGLVGILGGPGAIKSGRQKNYAQNAYTLYYKYARTFQKNLIQNFLPGVIDFITPDNEYIKAKQKAVIYGGAELKKFQDRFGSVKEHAKEVKYISELVQTQGLLDVVGEEINPAEFREGNLTTVGKNRLEKLGKRFEVLLSSVPLNPLNWLPGVRQITGMDSLSTKDYNDQSIKSIYTQNFLHKAIDTVFGGVKSALDIIDDPFKYNQISIDLFNRTKDISLSQKELESKVSTLTKKMRANSYLGTLTDSRISNETAQALEQLDLVSSQSARLQSIAESKFYYKQGVKGSTGSQGKKGFFSSNSKQLGLIGGLLFADYALENTLFSNQGLDLHQQLSLFKAVKTDEGNILGFEFNASVPAAVNVLAVGTAAFTAGRLLPKFEVTNLEDTIVGKKIHQAVQLADNTTDDILKASAQELLNKIKQTSITKTKFNYTTAAIAGVATTAGVKAVYGLYSGYLNSQYGNPNAANLDETLESAASKVRGSLLSFDSFVGSERTSTNKEYLKYFLGELNNPAPGGMPLSETISSSAQISLGIGQLTSLVKFEPGKEYGSLSFGFQLLPAFGIGFTPTMPLGLKIRRDNRQINEIGADSKYIPEEGITAENVDEFNKRKEGFLKLHSLLAPFDSFVYEKDSSFLAGSMFLGASLYTKSVLNLGKKYVEKGYGGGVFGTVSRAVAKEVSAIGDFATVAGGLGKAVDQITRATTSFGISLPVTYGASIVNTIKTVGQVTNPDNVFHHLSGVFGKTYDKVAPFAKKALPFYLGLSIATALTDPYMGMDSREQESIYYDPLNRLTSIAAIGIGGTKVITDLIDPTKKSVYESLPLLGNLIKAEREIIRSGSTMSKFMARTSLVGAGLFTASLLSKFVARSIGNTTGAAGLESFYNTPIGSLFRIASGISSEEYEEENLKNTQVNPLLSVASDFFNAITLNKFNFKDTLGVYKDQPNLFIPIIGTNQGLSFKEEKGFGGYYQIQGAVADLSFSKYELFKATTNKDQILTLAELINVDSDLLNAPGGDQLAVALTLGATARKSKARYTRYTDSELSAIKSSTQSTGAALRSYLVQRVATQRAVENRLAGIREGISTGYLNDVEGFSQRDKTFSVLDELEVLYMFGKNKTETRFDDKGFFGGQLNQDGVFDYVTKQNDIRVGAPRLFDHTRAYDFINKFTQTPKEDTTPTNWAAAAFAMVVVPTVAISMFPSLFLFNESIKENWVKQSYAVSNAKHTEIINDFESKARTRSFFTLDSVEDGIYFGNKGPNAVLRKLEAPEGLLNQKQFASRMNVTYKAMTDLMVQRLKGNVDGRYVGSIKHKTFAKVAAGGSTAFLRDDFVKFLKSYHSQSVKVGDKSFNSLELFYGVKSEEEFVEKVGSLIPEDEYKKIGNKIKAWQAAGLNQREIIKRLKTTVNEIEARTYNQFYSNFGRAENYTGSGLDESININSRELPKSIIGSAFTQSGKLISMYSKVIPGYGIAESVSYLLSGNSREREIASNQFVRVIGSEIAVGAAAKLAQSITKRSGLISLGLGLAGYGLYNVLKTSKTGKFIQDVESTVGDFFANVTYGVSSVLQPIFSPIAGAIRKTIFEPLGGVIESTYNKLSKRGDITGWIAQSLLPMSMFKDFDAPTSRKTRGGYEPFLYGSSRAVAEYLRQERAEKLKGLSQVKQPINIVHSSLLGQVNSFVESEKYNLYFRTSPSGRQSASAIGSFSLSSVFRLSNTQRLGLKLRQEKVNWAEYGANYRRQEAIGSSVFSDLLSNLLSVGSKTANREGVNAFALIKEDLQFYKDRIKGLIGSSKSSGFIDSFKELWKSTKSLLSNIKVPQFVKDEIRLGKKVVNQTLVKPVHRTTKELLNQTFSQYKSNFSSIAKGSRVTLDAFGNYLRPAGESIFEDYSRIDSTIGTYALDLFKEVKEEVSGIVLDSIKTSGAVIRMAPKMRPYLYNKVQNLTNSFVLRFDTNNRVFVPLLKNSLEAKKELANIWYKGAGFTTEAYKDIRKNFFSAQNKRRFLRSGRVGFNVLGKASPAILDVYNIKTGLDALNELNPQDDIHDFYMGRSSRMTTGVEAQERYSSQGSTALGVLAGSIMTGIFAAPIIPALLATAAFSYIGNQLGTHLAIKDMRNKDNTGKNILNLLSYGAIASSVFSTFMTAVAPKRKVNKTVSTPVTSNYQTVSPDPWTSNEYGPLNDPFANINNRKLKPLSIDDPWAEPEYKPQDISDPWHTPEADHLNNSLMGDSEKEARNFIRNLESANAISKPSAPKLSSKFIKTFHFFDLETSGLRHTDVAGQTTGTPEILQIARKSVQIDMRTGQTVDLGDADGFIMPTTPLDQLEFTPKFGVERIQKEGKTFNQTFNNVMGDVFDANSSAVIAGHNIREFDIQVVAENLRRQGRHAEAEYLEKASKLDTLKDVSPDHYHGMGLQSRKLENTYKQITGKTLEGAHTADADVKANILLFQEMIRTGELDPDTLEFLTPEERVELKRIYANKRQIRKAAPMYDRPIGPEPLNTKTSIELKNTQNKISRGSKDQAATTATTATTATSKGLNKSLKFKSTLVDVFEAADVLEKSAVIAGAAQSSFISVKSSLGLSTKEEMRDVVAHNTAMGQSGLVGAMLGLFGSSAPTRIATMAGGYLLSKMGVDLTFGLGSDYSSKENQRIEDSNVYANGIGSNLAMHLSRTEVQQNIVKVPELVKASKVFSLINRRALINKGIRGSIGYAAATIALDNLFGNEYNVDTGYKRNPLIDVGVGLAAAGVTAFYNPVDLKSFKGRRRFIKAKRALQKPFNVTNTKTSTTEVNKLFNEAAEKAQQEIATPLEQNEVFKEQVQVKTDSVQKGQQSYKSIKAKSLMVTKSFKSGFKSFYKTTSKSFRSIKNSVLKVTDSYWNSSRTSLKVGSGVLLAGTALATMGLAASNDDSTDLTTIAKDLTKTSIAFGVMAYLSLNAEKVATSLTKRINTLDQRIKSNNNTTTTISPKYKKAALHKSIGSAGAIGASAVALSYLYNLFKGWGKDEDEEKQQVDPAIIGAAGFFGKMTVDHLYRRSVDRRAVGKSVYKVLKQDKVRFNKFISTTGRQYGTAASSAALSYFLIKTFDKDKDDNIKSDTKALVGAGLTGAAFYGLSKSRLANAKLGKYGTGALIGAGIGAVTEKILFDSDKPLIGSAVGATLGAYVAFGASRNKVISGLSQKFNKAVLPMQIGSNLLDLKSGVTNLLTAHEFDYDKKAAGYQNITNATFSLLSIIGTGASLASIPATIAGGLLNAKQAQDRSERFDKGNAETFDYLNAAAGDITFQMKSAALSNILIKSFKQKTTKKSLLRIAELTKDGSRIISKSDLLAKGLVRGLDSTGKVLPKVIKKINKGGFLSKSLKFGARLASKLIDVADIAIGTSQLISGISKFKNLKGSSTSDEVNLAYEQTFTGTGRIAGTAVSSMLSKFLYVSAGVAGTTGIGLPVAIGLAGLGLAIDVYGGDIGAGIGSFLGKAGAKIHNARDYKQIRDKAYRQNESSNIITEPVITQLGIPITNQDNKKEIVQPNIDTKLNDIQTKISNFGRSSVASVVSGSQSVLSQMMGSLGFQRLQKRSQAISAQQESSDNWLSRIFGRLSRAAALAVQLSPLGVVTNAVGNLLRVSNIKSAASKVDRVLSNNKVYRAARGLAGRAYRAFGGGGESGSNVEATQVPKTPEEKRKEFRQEAVTRTIIASGLAEPSGTGRVEQLKIQGAELDLVKRLLLAEAGNEGQLGMALVARSLLNRQAMVKSGTVSAGTYNATGSSLTQLIMARNQFQPITDGAIHRARTTQQLKNAEEALKMAFDTDLLKSQLKKQGKDSLQITNLLQATGFRAGYAFDDPSQNYKRTQYKNHIFNSDKFARSKNVEELFNKYAANQNAVIAKSVKTSEKGKTVVKELLKIVQDKVQLEIDLTKEEIETGSYEYAEGGQRFDSKKLMSNMGSYDYRKKVFGSRTGNVRIKGTKMYVTSGYGERDPGSSGGSTRHGGVDVAGLAPDNTELRQVNPFALAKVTKAEGGFGTVVLMELDPKTKKETGRGALYYHSDVMYVKPGQEIKFKTPVGRQGTSGGKYAKHSHFTLFVEGSNPTIDGANTASYSGYNSYAPNLQEIKTAHEFSNKPLAPVVRIGNQYRTVKQAEAQQALETITTTTQSNKGLKPQGTYITLTDSGRKLNNGMPILELAMFKDGKLVKKLNALSGKPEGQGKNRHESGSMTALPEGVWKTAAKARAGEGDGTGVGTTFLDLIPTFQTGRTNIGIHWDEDKNRTGLNTTGTKAGIGSAGCVVLNDIASRDYVNEFVKRNGSINFYVDITKGDDTDLGGSGSVTTTVTKTTKELKERLQRQEAAKALLAEGKYFGAGALNEIVSMLKEGGATEKQIQKVKQDIDIYNKALPKEEQERARKLITAGKDPNGLDLKQVLVAPTSIPTSTSSNPINKLKAYVAPKANKKDWVATDQTKHKKIYLMAGHTDHSSGTSGASGKALSYAPGRSAESVVTREIMLKISQLSGEYGVSVEIDAPTKKESSHKPQIDRAIKKEKQGYYAVEIHLDAPIGLGGTGSGLIPSYNDKGSISITDEKLAEEYGAFSKHHRDGLYATNRGISLLEVDVFQGETEKVIRYGSKAERDAYYEYHARRFLQTVSGKKFETLAPTITVSAPATQEKNNIVPTTKVNKTKGYSVSKLNMSQIKLDHTKVKLEDRVRAARTIFIKTASGQVIEKQLRQDTKFSAQFLDESDNQVFIEGFTQKIKSGKGSSRSNAFEASEVTINSPSKLKIESGSFLMPSTGDDPLEAAKRLEEAGYEILGTVGSGYISGQGTKNTKAVGFRFSRIGGKIYEDYGSDRLSINKAGYITYASGQTKTLDLRNLNTAAAQKTLQKLKSDKNVIGIHLLSDNIVDSSKPGAYTSSHKSEESVARSMLVFNQQGQVDSAVITGEMNYRDQNKVVKSINPNFFGLVLDGDLFARWWLADKNVDEVYKNKAALAKGNPIFLVRQKEQFQSAKAPTVSKPLDSLPTKKEVEQLQAEAINKNKQQDIARLIADPEAYSGKIMTKLKLDKFLPAFLHKPAESMIVSMIGAANSKQVIKSEPDFSWTKNANLKQVIEPSRLEKLKSKSRLQKTEVKTVTSNALIKPKTTLSKQSVSNNIFVSTFNWVFGKRKEEDDEQEKRKISAIQINYDKQEEDEDYNLPEEDIDNYENESKGTSKTKKKSTKVTTIGRSVKSPSSPMRRTGGRGRSPKARVVQTRKFKGVSSSYSSKRSRPSQRFSPRRHSYTAKRSTVNLASRSRRGITSSYGPGNLANRVPSTRLSGRRGGSGKPAKKIVIKNTPRASKPNQEPGMVQRGWNWIQRKLGWKKGSIIVSIFDVKSEGATNILSNTSNGLNSPSYRIPVDPTYQRASMGRHC